MGVTVRSKVLLLLDTKHLIVLQKIHKVLQCEEGTNGSTAVEAEIGTGSPRSIARAFFFRMDPLPNKKHFLDYFYFSHVERGPGTVDFSCV